MKRSHVNYRSGQSARDRVLTTEPRRQLGLWLGNDSATHQYAQEGVIVSRNRAAQIESCLLTSGYSQILQNEIPQVFWDSHVPITSEVSVKLHLRDGR